MEQILQQIEAYKQEIEALPVTDSKALEDYRIKFLGTKGIIKDLFDQFKTVGPEEKRTFGKVLNQFKQLAEERYNELKESSATAADTARPRRGAA